MARGSVFLERACPNDDCALHAPTVAGGPVMRATWTVRAIPDHGVNVPLGDEEMRCRECGTPSVPEESIDLLVAPFCQFCSHRHHEERCRCPECGRPVDDPGSTHARCAGA